MKLRDAAATASTHTTVTRVTVKRNQEWHWDGREEEKERESREKERKNKFRQQWTVNEMHLWLVCQRCYCKTTGRWKRRGEDASELVHLRLCEIVRGFMHRIDWCIRQAIKRWPVGDERDERERKKGRKERCSTDASWIRYPITLVFVQLFGVLLCNTKDSVIRFATLAPITFSSSSSSSPLPHFYLFSLHRCTCNNLHGPISLQRMRMKTTSVTSLYIKIDPLASPLKKLTHSPSSSSSSPASFARSTKAFS